MSLVPEDPNRVLLFDTTLRDGEQSPGISLNAAEKLEIAQQLARLGVDIIEAGFPIASPGDFEAVRTIARADYDPPAPVICALARANPSDIDRAWEAIKDAERPRIHTFLSTSDIHIEHQLQSTREDVKGLARASVAQAKALCEDVEFSPMDATRSEAAFTAEVLRIALEEGATTINIPDTVGYATPDEYGEFLTELYNLVPGLRDVVVSVHCHDDLGLAVANSLAGVRAGARQIECAVNGIGERAGNASLEELIMLLHTRRDRLGYTTGAVTTEIARTSRLVSRLTGYSVQPNKAIVGKNAFAHESGIHQDGVLKARETYEIMDARSVGLDANSIVLGKHSGRAALRQALEDLGYPIDGAMLKQAFERFKEVADRKKQVTAMDLEALVTDELRGDVQGYSLEWFEVEASNQSARPPFARVAVRTPEDAVVEGTFNGDGPIDAIFRAINSATKIDGRLREFRVDAVTGGQDALGEVSVVVELGSAEDAVKQGTPGVLTGQRVTGAGQAVEPDIIHAAAIAYVRALGNAVSKAQAAVSDAELAQTP